MTSINNFDVNVYSEETYQVTESEYDEVMSLMADDEQDFAGYTEWSQAVEAAAWNGAQSFNGVLIKKACSHATCSHFECSRGLRLGGIEICAPRSAMME
jgi:hypothetical protein